MSPGWTYEVWWAHQDLNLEPTDYESAALTVELWARWIMSIEVGLLPGLECCGHVNRWRSHHLGNLSAEHRGCPTLLNGMACARRWGRAGFRSIGAASGSPSCIAQFPDFALNDLVQLVDVGCEFLRISFASDPLAEFDHLVTIFWGHGRDRSLAESAQDTPELSWRFCAGTITWKFWVRGR